MKQPSIQIHDARPSKKNPNATYIVKYVGKNGEPINTSEALNDVKAVKTNIRAAYRCASLSGNEFEARQPIDYTKEQKFAKSNYAAPNPKKK
jgi:hypothetical protein